MDENEQNRTTQHTTPFSFLCFKVNGNLILVLKKWTDYHPPCTETGVISKYAASLHHGTMSRPGTRYGFRSKMCCIAMSPLDLIHARHDFKTMNARRAAKHIQTGKMKYIHSLFTPLSTSMHHCHLIVPFILAALCQGPHGREENYRLPDN